MQDQTTQAASYLPILLGVAASATNGRQGEPCTPKQRMLQPGVRNRIALRRVDVQPSQAISARPRAHRCCLTLLTCPPCRPRSLDAYAFWRHCGFSGTLAGLGLSPGLHAPGSAGGMRTPAAAAKVGSSAPGIGSFGYFPPTPQSPLSGLTAPSAPRDAGKRDD